DSALGYALGLGAVLAAYAMGMVLDRSLLDARGSDLVRGTLLLGLLLLGYLFAERVFGTLLSFGSRGLVVRRCGILSRPLCLPYAEILAAAAVDAKTSFGHGPSPKLKIWLRGGREIWIEPIKQWPSAERARAAERALSSRIGRDTRT